MLEVLKQYFYNHYEDNGEPYADSSSYHDVSEFFRNATDENIQQCIYDIGLHVLAKAIVAESMDRLESVYTKEKEQTQ